VILPSLSFVLASVGTLLLPVRASSSSIEAAVTHRGTALPGAVVVALPSPVFDPGAPGRVVSGPTGRDGKTVMDLGPGSWYLFARRKGTGTAAGLEPGDRFGYYGANPLVVRPNRPLAVGIATLAVPAEGPEEAGRTGVAGQLLFEDKPLGRAYLYAYRDEGGGFRGLGFSVTPVGERGAFRVSLPPGTWYLVARRRVGGGMQGPLRRNDLFGWYPGNPVRVTENHTRVITLELVRLSDMPDDVSPRDASDRAVGGVVRDAAGKAISGMRVLAHDNEALSGKPAAVSAETGPDGAFRLELPPGGPYWLVARRRAGGPPEEGELYGRLESGGKSRVVSPGDGPPPRDLVIVVKGYRQQDR
jgi:hypothetical protein